MSEASRLLERETFLAELRRAHNEALAGNGRVVLVTGEAGIGKTVLLERFSREISTRVIWGSCEAIFTPRPLGPFYDIAHQLGGSLLGRLKRKSRQADLFHELLDALRDHAAPICIVIEDLHWADHATLDFVRFFGRRLSKLPVLLALSLRDDEIGVDHPLATVLGELPAANRSRLKLPNLSRETVEQLARDAKVPVTHLFRITAGNPFFVTEVLRGGDEPVAASVRESVLARAKFLSKSARALLDLASVAPDRVELGLIEHVLPHSAKALEECLARGLLLVEGEYVAFRHELARLAVEASLSSPGRMRCNRALLDGLERATLDSSVLTRLAHHAIAAHHAQSILQYAPRAAQDASEKGAHREALVLLCAIVPHLARLSRQEQAEFQERLAAAHFVMGETKEAMHASEAAYLLWDGLGDSLAMGRNLAQRCNQAWGVLFARLDELRAKSREAVRLLEEHSPGVELALAYSALSVLLARDDAVAATAHRGKASALLARKGDRDASLEAEVLVNIVLSELMCTGEPSLASTMRLLTFAKASNNDRRVVSAYFYLAIRAMCLRDLDGAEGWIREGSHFVRSRQLERYPHARALEHSIGGWVAASRCDWAGARAHLAAVLTGPRGATLLESNARVRLALMAARQGEVFDRDWLIEALRRDTEQLPHDEFQLHRNYAEIAWLTGDGDAARRAARVARRISQIWGSPWRDGEAAYWEMVTGNLSDPPKNAAEPYALQFAGDARAAALAWKKLGHSYDQALALMMGDLKCQGEAVTIFVSLGATAAAEQVRTRMRGQGARGIPRGPIASTKANPSGLTKRELEVLSLLAEGLSNVAMARHIHRSVKTVDHHVASVLEKLGASQRKHAVAIARERGILAKNR